MKIGDFKPQNNVFLAPMAGVTDVVFRTICKEQGCGLTYSEMVSAKGIMYDNDNTKKLLEIKYIQYNNFSISLYHLFI